MDCWQAKFFSDNGGKGYAFFQRLGRYLLMLLRGEIHSQRFQFVISHKVRYFISGLEMVAYFAFCRF
jgi:hypothetical protein